MLANQQARSGRGPVYASREAATVDGNRKASAATATTPASSKKTCPHRTTQTTFESVDEETTYIVDKLVGMWWNKGSWEPSTWSGGRAMLTQHDQLLVAFVDAPWQGLVRIETAQGRTQPGGRICGLWSQVFHEAELVRLKPRRAFPTWKGTHVGTYQQTEGFASMQYSLSGDCPTTGDRGSAPSLSQAGSL